MKKTNRALLTSVIALLLCCSMLVGSTFAWFTDSATSGSNVITSGNLDIEVEYTLDGENWANLDGAKDLFSKGLWEPGHTEVVALRITNKGSLALKYSAHMNIFTETVGQTKDGEEIKLSEILSVSTLAFEDAGVDPVFGINIAERSIEEAFKSENGIAYNAATAFKAANVLEDDQHLLPKATQYVVIKVDMPESVGNEANHDGVHVPSIEFGVDILATQYTHEDDSFGDQYDADAKPETIIDLNEGDDLLAALAGAEKNTRVTIRLHGNVEWPTEGHHGENDITPASAIVIEGNGYTITATGSGVTPLGDKEAPMTLKNVKIVDNSVSYNEAAWELSYLEMGGKVLKCINVDFADPISVDSDNAIFTGCSFVGHYDKNSTSTTQYGVWVANGNSTFTGCTFTGTRAMKICDQYAPEVGTVVIDDCTFNCIGEKPGVCIDDHDVQNMQITIKNSEFIDCQAGDQKLFIYETDNTVPTLENNTVYNSVTPVTTLAELREAMENGGEYKLAADINVSSTELLYKADGGHSDGSAFLIKADMVLDLNGHNITVDAPSYAADVFFVNGGHTFTVKGNGTVTADCGIFVAYDAATTINIEGGHYKCTTNNDMLYAIWGKLNVSGGTYETAYWNLINIYGQGNIALVDVTGGSFKNWNPASSPDGNLLADGYTVKSETVDGVTWYTVIPK